MSKKIKSLDDLTHLDLVEALIYCENIQDNLSVSNDYPEDQYGNSMITMGFEGVPNNRRRTATHAMILFTFNRQGRLVSLEVATREKGNRKWQVATSEKLIDMKTRFGIEPSNKTN
jgi:hypothetical protein